MRVVTTLHVKQEMTEKKRSQKLPIIIKKRTISSFHTNAGNAKKLSMMHLLRLPIEKEIFKINDSNDNEQSDNFIITKKLI